MNWIPLLNLFVFVAVVPSAFCQTAATWEPRWKQLDEAYGFVRGQQASLHLIEMKFPDLAEEVKAARLAFNASALGEGYKGVEDELALELGEQWPTYKHEAASTLNSLSAGHNVTRQQAVAFLRVVHQRALGDIPDVVRSVLLSAHPRFIKNPALEMAEGWQQTFSTKGHPKAKAIAFQISIPASWSKREGKRPNIVQVFRSRAGHGPIRCVLLVRSFPGGYVTSRNELKESFKPDALKDSMPDGSTLIDAKEIVLDGLPAGMLISQQNGRRLDIEITIRTTQFITIYQSSMIALQFSVMKTPDVLDSLESLHEQFLPVFKAVANTFVLNDRYK